MFHTPAHKFVKPSQSALLPNVATTKEYGAVFENHLRSGRFDSKGREIGFIVGFRDNGDDFRAYVQNARRVAGEWVEFGATQRSKSFRSQVAAASWAYATANDRIAKIKA